MSRGVGSARINAAKLLTNLAELAEIIDPDQPPYTRRAFSRAYEKGRQWLRAVYEGAGLQPRLDEAGNLIGRMEGLDPTLPPIMIGSHIDTVVGGGRFDGTYGVLAGVEVARWLSSRGQRLHHTLEVVDFLSEEASDYGPSCVGSRGMVGTLSADMLARTNALGESLADAIRRVGGWPEALSRPLRRPGDVAAYLEAHIEQGPVLYNSGHPLGVVTGIVAIRRLNVHVVGRAAHAGTTPMALRKDALAGASELIRFVFQLARRWHGQHPLVATVGRMDVSPNTANVVPGRCTMTLEVRSLSEADIDRFLEEVMQAAEQVRQEYGVDVTLDPVSHSPAIICSERVRAILAQSCVHNGYAFLELPSAAGHDAMHIASIAPVGMLFVRSVDGLSHCPEEFSHAEDLVAGAEVLLDAVLALDKELWRSSAK